MALVELSYDELEVILIALVLRQEEIYTIPRSERTDATRYEIHNSGELSDKLNNAQHAIEQEGIDQIERDLGKRASIQKGKPRANWLVRHLVKKTPR